jgi:hypothetical protein
MFTPRADCSKDVDGYRASYPISRKRCASRGEYRTHAILRIKVWRMQAITEYESRTREVPFPFGDLLTDTPLAGNPD